MRVSDKRHAPKAANYTPPAAAVSTPDATVTRVSRDVTKRSPLKAGLKITPALLHATRYGEMPKPSHTPEEIAALKSNNDPRLTSSGVIVVPPSLDTRGGTPFPPRAAYDGSQRREEN